MYMLTFFVLYYWMIEKSIFVPPPLWDNTLFISE